MEIDYAKATVRLPAKYFKEIGRVITIFACVEHILRLISYKLLRLTPAEGMLTVRAARIGDYCRMIQDLLNLQSIKITHNLLALSKDLSDFESMRDWFSHGVWTKHNGAIHVLLTSGKWQAGSLQGTSRKIAPSIHLVTPQQISGIADEGRRLLTYVNDVYCQIAAQQNALQRKSPVQHPPKSGGVQHHPTRQAHIARRKSSPA